MTIRDFQNKIAEDLNGVKELVQNGCVVFAEDMLTTQNELNSAVATAGRIAVVVVTPRFERDGCGDGGLPAGATLLVRCIEAPALRARRRGYTALAAAEAVAHALDSDGIGWRSIEQTADAQRGVATATAEFGVSILLSEEQASLSPEDPE